MIVTANAKKVRGKIIPIENNRVFTAEERAILDRAFLDFALYRAGQGLFNPVNEEASNQ